MAPAVKSPNSIQTWLAPGHRPAMGARASYNRLSRWYDTLASSEQRYVAAGIDCLDVRPGDRVLEVGCGTGHGLAKLASAAGQVVGCDVSEGMLAVAHRCVRHIVAAPTALTQADARSLPYAADSFDAVFMSFTLELFAVPDVPCVLVECWRVLRTAGGIGVVALATRAQNNLVTRLYMALHEMWPAVIDCRPMAVEEALCAAGFDITDAHNVSLWGLPVAIARAQKRTMQA